MSEPNKIAYNFTFMLQLKFSEGLEKSYEDYEFNRFKETIKERNEIDKIAYEILKINKITWNSKILNSKDIYLLHPLYVFTEERLNLLNNNLNIPYEEGLKQLVQSRALIIRKVMIRFVKDILIEAFYFPLSNDAISSLI